MEKDRFNALLANLDQITDADIKSLNQLRKQYPYFQNQYVMMAKALKERAHPKADAFVKKAALYVADQGLLKGIINGTHSFVTTAVAEDNAPALDNHAAQIEEVQAVVEPIAEVVETKEEATETVTEAAAEPTAEAEESKAIAPEPEVKAEAESTPEAKPETTEAKTEAATTAASEPEAKAKPKPEEIKPTPPAPTEKVEAAESSVVQEAKPEEEKAVEEEAEPTSDSSDAMISELEKDLEEIKAKKRLLARMLEQSESKEKAKAPAAEKKTAKRSKKNQSELIEKFIKNEPQMDKQKLVSDENSPAQIDLASKNLKSSDNFYTETLAKLMVKQKKYKKAIQIYENLGLKFPEKRAYFASQIEKVNNKSNV